MSADTEWARFYGALCRIGPTCLKGVHKELSDHVAEAAVDTDSFWSDGLEEAFSEHWATDPAKAVEEALAIWVENVKSYLEGILDPEESLILPALLSMGWTKAKWRASRKSIPGITHTLDAAQLRLFASAVGISLADVSAACSIAVQGVVHRIGRVSDGDLVRAAAIPWNAVVAELRRDWQLAYSIPARRWEELIAGALDREGFDEVVLTPASGDHGRDVIATKRGMLSIRVIGSVKAYKPGHLVKHDDVRALAGVLHGDLSASKGIITTTSGFAPGIPTDPILRGLMPTRLELIDGSALQKWLISLCEKR